jgi:hypothetical protein
MHLGFWGSVRQSSRPWVPSRMPGTVVCRSSAAEPLNGRIAPMSVVQTSGTVSPKMVYRGGCVTEYAEYLERSPSTYDEQIGVAWPQEARKER